MASLMDSLTDQILRHSFSVTVRFSRHEFAAREQAAADHGGGHLDFLVAGYDTSRRFGSAAVELAPASAAMTGDHTAMHAGMARTAHEEGFEEIAGWFETLAKTGRSDALGHEMNA